MDKLQSKMDKQNSVEGQPLAEVSNHDREDAPRHELIANKTEAQADYDAGIRIRLNDNIDKSSKKKTSQKLKHQNSHSESLNSYG